MRKTFFYQFTHQNRRDKITLDITKDMTIYNLLKTIADINHMGNVKLHVHKYSDDELLKNLQNNTFFRIETDNQTSNQKNTKSSYFHYKKESEANYKPQTHYDDNNTSSSKRHKQMKKLIDGNNMDKYTFDSVPKLKIQEEDSSKPKDQKSSQKSEITEVIQKTSRQKRNKSVLTYKPKIIQLDEEKKSPEPKSKPKPEPKSKPEPNPKPEPKSKPKPQPQQKSKSSEKVKYWYQTNKDSDIHEIELDQKATVLTMKQQIANSYDVKNVKNVQIVFAGKELLDELNLKSLEIGDAILFAYIRREDDVILLTAKALKFDINASDYSDADF